MKTYKQFVTMDSHEKMVVFNSTLKIKKFRISFLRFLTADVGGTTLFILVDGMNQHPISGYGFSEYTKVLPIYSGADLDYMYVADASLFDSEFEEPITLSRLKIHALVNGEFNDTQISTLNPLRLEIEIITE